MTSYVPGTGVSFSSSINALIEQRVTNQLLQSDMGKPSQEELRLMRNDIAASLGIIPPIVPGD